MKKKIDDILSRVSAMYRGMKHNFDFYVQEGKPFILNLYEDTKKLKFEKLYNYPENEYQVRVIYNEMILLYDKAMSLQNKILNDFHWLIFKDVDIKEYLGDDYTEENKDDDVFDPDERMQIPWEIITELTYYLSNEIEDYKRMVGLHFDVQIEERNIPKETPNDEIEFDENNLLHQRLKDMLNSKERAQEILESCSNREKVAEWIGNNKPKLRPNNKKKFAQLLFELGLIEEKDIYSNIYKWFKRKKS